jgi:RimJ/RimL family protein N-acetyltransferase
MERVLNLKKHLRLLPQYVELRNSYCELLLTQPVDIRETRHWIDNASVEVRVIEENNYLLGVALLYLDKDGEVAFFSRHKNKGTGTKLLKMIDNIAIHKSLKSIWAWVREDNIIAARVFEKCGYCAMSRDERLYNDKLVIGIKYIKHFQRN